MAATDYEMFEVRDAEGKVLTSDWRLPNAISDAAGFTRELDAAVTIWRCRTVVTETKIRTVRPE